MSVIWNGYEIFDPGVDRPLNEVPRTEARLAYERLMAAREQRKQMLVDLLKQNGIYLGMDDDSIRALNQWLLTNVQEDPENLGRLLPRWYSVVNDIALYLGDLVIARASNLRWVFYTGGKRDDAYQRHVIVGFTKIANKKYHADLDLAIATWAHRIIRQLPVEDNYLIKLVDSVTSKA